MIDTILQYVLYVVILIALAIPLGRYIGKIMNGEKVFLSKIVVPCENFIYRIIGMDKDEEMTWKKYALSVLLFSGIGFVFLFLLQILQGILPLNREGLPGFSWHLAFNNASSFLTNTNWQAYSGESAASYLTQMLGFTVQNFLSAAVGIAVLFVLIRGFIQVKKEGLGNFWKDVTRILLYILIPLSLVISVVLVSQGVVQNFKKYDTVSLVEPIKLEDGTVVTQEVVPQGPAASQIAIKQLGTNGGGFFGTNAAHPFENPNPLTNLVEMLSILLIPMALCFTFGRNVRDKRQGVAIFMSMFILLAACGIVRIFWDAIPLSTRSL